MLALIHGDASIDDVEHAFFHCERWVLERRNLKAKVGACTIENYCYIILSSEVSCAEVLLKSKYRRLDRFSDIVAQSGRGCGHSVNKVRKYISDNRRYMYAHRTHIK